MDKFHSVVFSSFFLYFKVLSLCMPEEQTLTLKILAARCLDQHVAALWPSGDENWGWGGHGWGWRAGEGRRAAPPSPQL